MLVYSLEESECMSGFQTMCPKPMLVTRALAGVTSDVWQVFVNHGDVFHAVMFFLKPCVFQKPFCPCVDQSASTEARSVEALFARRNETERCYAINIKRETDLFLETLWNQASDLNLMSRTVLVSVCLFFMWVKVLKVRFEVNNSTVKSFLCFQFVMGRHICMTVPASNRVGGVGF